MRFVWDVSLGAILNGLLVLLAALLLLNQLLPLVRRLLDDLHHVLQTLRLLQEQQASRYSELHSAVARLRAQVEDAGRAPPGAESS